MIASMDDVRLDDLSPNESVAVEEAIALADSLLREALANSTRSERRQLQRLGRLVADQRVANWCRV